MHVKALIGILFLLILSYCSLQGQGRGKLQLELNGSVNVGLNEGYPLWGWGSHFKFLWPVKGKENLLTATIGVDRLFEDFDSYGFAFALASFGYRKSIRQFFIEPKAGLGMSESGGNTNICGFLGIEPGVMKRKFNFSIDYRFISSDGLVDGDHFHTFAIRVGYRITERNIR